jgi:hypothetical protein
MVNSNIEAMHMSINGSVGLEWLPHSSNKLRTEKPRCSLHTSLLPGLSSAYLEEGIRRSIDHAIAWETFWAFDLVKMLDSASYIILREVPWPIHA